MGGELDRGAGNPLMLRRALLLLPLLMACSRDVDVFEGRQVTRTETTNAVSSAGQPGAATTSNLDSRVPSVVFREKDPCHLSRIELDDSSGGALLSTQTLRDLLDGEARRVFGPVVDDGKGFVLSVRLALREGQSLGTPTVFFGIVGFLTRATAPVSEVFDVQSSRDFALSSLPVDKDRSLVLSDELVKPELGLVLELLRDKCEISLALTSDLSSWMKDSRMQIRQAAALEAGERGDPSLIPPVVSLLDDPEPGIVQAAAGALPRLSSEDDVVQALVASTARASETLFQVVAAALADIDTPLARRYLESWATGHPLTSIRSLCTELLADPGH